MRSPCRRFVSLSYACVLLLLALPATQAQELFRDELASGVGWGMNATSADAAATFGYDYSADGIPEAPNSRGDDGHEDGGEPRKPRYA